MPTAPRSMRALEKEPVAPVISVPLRELDVMESCPGESTTYLIP